MGEGVKPDQPRWLTEPTPVRVADPPVLVQDPLIQDPLIQDPLIQDPLIQDPLVRESLLAPLAAVFSQHQANLTRYAARITRDADAARDVVQDVFARLCREPAADLNGQLAPWLYAACRNRAIDARRKDSRMTLAADVELFAIASDSDDPHGARPEASRGCNLSAGAESARMPGAAGEPHGSAVDPSHQAAARDESAKVLSILSRLAASQQEAVCLRFSCGLSYKEIAAVMELSVSHVGVLLHTAIAALREKMRD